MKDIILLLLTAFLIGCVGTAYPLHQAASNGDQPTVRLLIDRGDNVNEKNGAGWTPLMDAAFVGHVGIAKMLLEHGADPTLTNNQGQTALTLARQQDRTLVIDLLEGSLTRKTSP